MSEIMFVMLSVFVMVVSAFIGGCIIYSKVIGRISELEFTRKIENLRQEINENVFKNIENVSRVINKTSIDLAVLEGRLNAYEKEYLFSTEDVERRVEDNEGKGRGSPPDFKYS